jgi:predicted permease
MVPFNDFRYALRQLRKSPTFTATILLTLGLCIGANTAIFSIVDQVFFRALPYPDPARLMMIARAYHKGNLSATQSNLNGFAWQSIRDQAPSLESAVYLAGSNGVNLFANNHVEYVQKQQVCAGFFHTLGIHPLIGREFTRQEDVPGGPQLAVLRYAMWQRIFRGDSGILGRSIDLEGAPYTVIGVMPRDFRTDAPQAQVWTPLQASTTGMGAGTNYHILARLKPGATASQANTELASISPAVGAQIHFEPGTFSLSIIPLQAGRTMSLRSNVKLVWTAAGLILLIGCINIAGILLARSTTRSREIATRLALGGPRRAIIGQLLSESLILACSGGLLGLLLGSLVINGLNHLSSTQLNLPEPLQLNMEVLTAMAAVSLLAGVVFGLFPAFEATAIDLRSALAEARTSSGTPRQRKRQILVFAEVAIGVLLVVSAGLLIRSLSSLLNINPGFDAHHVVTASLSLQDARYKTTSDAARLFRESVVRMRQIPAVESAGITLTLPYERALNSGGVSISGHPVRPDNSLVNFVYATPGLFTALRIPVLRGCLFTDHDRADTQKVAVVDQAFVNYYLPNTSDPIGEHIALDSSHSYTIVGIIHDIPQQQGWGVEYGPIANLPQMWIPAVQLPDRDFSIIHQYVSPSWVVRTQGAVPHLEQKMRQAILAVDPRLPFSGFHTIDQLRDEALKTQRYQAVVFSAFAGLAILLCALGVYGLIAQSVVQRTREMGIRLALGASRENIVRAAVLPGLKLSIAGIVCGIILSLFATRLLKSFIWGIAPTDLTTFIAVAVLLTTIAAFASLIPALRLIKLDPAQTLRDE